MIPWAILYFLQAVHCQSYVSAGGKNTLVPLGTNITNMIHAHGLNSVSAKYSTVPAPAPAPVYTGRIQFL